MDIFDNYDGYTIEDNYDKSKGKYQAVRHVKDSVSIVLGFGTYKECQKLVAEDMIKQNKYKQKKGKEIEI